MDSTNIFEDEFNKQLESLNSNKNYLNLSDIISSSFLDDNTEFKINFFHLPTLYILDQEKNGKFTLENFSKFSKIYIEKEKVYKKYEFQSQLQGYFTLLMWKVYKFIKTHYINSLYKLII